MTQQTRIIDLVPHGEPMSLLDRVEHYCETGLVASVRLAPDSMFAEQQGVPSWVGIEYMGQAIAAYAGACARKNGEPVKIGFLVGTRRYEPGCSYFPFGKKLEVRVTPLTDNDAGLRVFECSISAENISVSAKLNVYMPENIEAFLQKES